jgi:hypothetical protein
MAEDLPAVTNPTHNTHHPSSSDDVTPTSTVAERRERETKEIMSEEDDKHEATHADPNFPDGGWRAWLVVFGVCSFASLLCFSRTYFEPLHTLGDVQYIFNVSLSHSVFSHYPHASSCSVASGTPPASHGYCLELPIEGLKTEAPERASRAHGSTQSLVI